MCMRFDETGRVAPHLLPLHRQGSALEHHAIERERVNMCSCAALVGTATGIIGECNGRRYRLHWRTLSTDTWFYMGPGVLLRRAFGKGLCHLLGDFWTGLHTFA